MPVLGGVGPSTLRITVDDLVGEVARAPTALPGEDKVSPTGRADPAVERIVLAEILNEPRGGTGGVPVGGVGARIDLEA